MHYTAETIAHAYTAAPNDYATISNSTISGTPRESFRAAVVGIEGETLYYTTDGIWVTPATRSDYCAWELVPAPKSAPRMASGIEGQYVHGLHVSAHDMTRAHRKLTLAIEDSDAALAMVDLADGAGDSSAALAAVDMALLAGSYRASARRMLGLGAQSTARAYYATAIG